MAEERLGYTLTLNTVATGNGARQTAEDLQRVRAASATAGDQLNTFNAQSQRVTASGVNMRTTISNVGFQIQDFAVQTAAGTSAVRAFSQQAPQLLSAFGPWGVVAGTAVAVAAPLIASLFKIGETAEQAGISVEDMAEAIERANERLIDGLTEGLTAQIRDQAKLRESFAETERAQAESAKSTLANDERIRQAKIAIAEALGLQIDRYNEIDARAAADAAKRKLETDQAIATENARLEKARQDRADAEAAKAAELQKQQEIQQALQKAEEDLAAVRAERARLQSIADKGGGIFNDPVENAEAANAQRRLDDGVSKQRLAELEDLVKQLTASAEQFEGVNGTLRAANVAIQEKINAEADIAQAARINIQQLQENRAVEDELAKFDTIKAKQDQQAKDLASTADGLQSSTAAAEQARQLIAQIASDGQISATESEQLARESVRIVGLIQSGQLTTRQNTQQVIQLLTTIGQDQTNFKTALRQIEERLRSGGL